MITEHQSRRQSGTKSVHLISLCSYKSKGRKACEAEENFFFERERDRNVTLTAIRISSFEKHLRVNSDLLVTATQRSIIIVLEVECRHHKAAQQSALCYDWFRNKHFHHLCSPQRWRESDQWTKALLVWEAFSATNLSAVVAHLSSDSVSPFCFVWLLQLIRTACMFLLEAGIFK